MSKKPFEEPDFEWGEVPPPGTSGVEPCADDELCHPDDDEDARGGSPDGDLVRMAAARLP